MYSFASVYEFLCFTRNFDQNVCPVRTHITQTRTQQLLQKKGKILKVPQRTNASAREFSSKHRSVGGLRCSTVHKLEPLSGICQDSQLGRSVIHKKENIMFFYYMVGSTEKFLNQLISWLEAPGKNLLFMCRKIWRCKKE